MQKAPASFLSSSILLHATVIILGFTGILGKIISEDAFRIVFWRMLIAALCLLPFILIKKKNLQARPVAVCKMLLTGFVVAAHWLAFYYAIKISNVSITVACLAVSPLMTSFLEPVLLKSKFSKLEAVIGIFTIIGISLVVLEDIQYTAGILVALLAAFLASLFTILNKKLSTSLPHLSISFWEMVGGFLFLSIIGLLFYPQLFVIRSISPADWLWIIVLASVCTAFAFWALIVVLKSLTAFHVTLAINLEPVYSIILAIIIFQENKVLSWMFYLGAGIILSGIFVYSLLKYQSKIKTFSAVSYKNV